MRETRWYFYLSDKVKDIVTASYFVDITVIVELDSPSVPAVEQSTATCVVRR